MKTILILLLLAVISGKGIIADELPPSSDITDYLADIENIPIEPGLLKKTDAAEKFVKKLTVEWKTVLSGIKTYAPSSREQVLLAIGAEFLKPSAYLEFVNNVCDVASIKEGGGVGDEFIVAIINASMVKNGFLAYYYNNEAVMPVIIKLKSCATQRMPGQWNEFFEAIESGEARNTVIEEAARYNTDLPEALNSEGVLK